MSRALGTERANLPMRNLKAWVRGQARQLLVEQPQGFHHADLADRLGPSYGRGQPQERRLRNCLNGMCRAGVLARQSRGRFVGGPRLTEDAALGVGVELMDQIFGAFFEAGGTVPMRELLCELDREDDISARLVRTALSGSSIYFSGVPLDGYRTHWLLIEAERKKVPLPGRWHLLELQLMAARMGRAWTWGMNEALASFRARIATSLRDARNLLGIEPEDIVADEKIGAALDSCLYSTRNLMLSRDGDRVAVGTWWNDFVEQVGSEDALVAAWRALERGTPNDHDLLQTLDVRFWMAVGNRTRLDPALLSRGALALDSAADLAFHSPLIQCS